MSVGTPRPQSHSLRRQSLLALVACGTFCCTTFAGGLSIQLPPTAFQIDDDTPNGHPDLAMAQVFLGDPDPVDPMTPPLVSGEYINFESPPFKPIAFDDRTGLVAAVNTPNGTVEIFTETADGLAREREIPVGIEPVTVAFQPIIDGAASRLWVINHISDNVMIVDPVNGAFLGLVELRDEPVGLVFAPSGETAFIVSQSGYLQSVDTNALTVVSELQLPANTPRAIVYDAANERVVIAALHSGNNTTVASRVMRHNTIDLNTGQQSSAFLPVLVDAQLYSETAAIFNASPELSPWPDQNPNVTQPAPLIARIIPDAGLPSGWADIVAIFDDGTGNPKQDKVDAYQDELNAIGLSMVNIVSVLTDLINDVQDTDDNDLITVDVVDPNNMFIAGIIGNVGTTLTGMAQNPLNGEICVSNLQALNTIRHDTNLRGHFIDHEIVFVGDPLDEATIAVADLHAGIPNYNDASAPNPAAQAGSLANPTDIIFTPDGSRAFVAALGTGRVGVMNGITGAIESRIDVGKGTRGLAFNSDSNRLYAYNRTDMTIATVAISDSPSVTDTTPLFTPESKMIREGRDFLYTTRESNNFSSSCGLCHINGNLDHNAWDLSQPNDGLQPLPPIAGAPDPNNPPPTVINHPMKGPMVTLSLRGLDNHEGLHWRGDRPTFADFNSTFDGLLGGAEISDADMAKFDAFTKSMVYPPNPNRNRDNSFFASAAANGRDHFIVSCNGCHNLSHDGALRIPESPGKDAGFDLGGLSAQVQLVPQLRHLHRKFDSDLYNGVGLIHDGREKREDNGHVIQTFLLEFFGNFTPTMRTEMIAFLDAYPTNVRPIVGLQAATTGSQNDPAGDDVSLMIDRHNQPISENDVIARRLRNGTWRGYVLIDGNAADPLFLGDVGEDIRLSQLLQQATVDNPTIFTAVPPGSGFRMGVDQDTDDFVNGIDPCPQYPNDGDMNGDGVTTVGDIGGFVLAITDPAGFAVQYPNVNRECAADVNADTFVTVGDIGPFVAILTGQ